MSMGSYLLIIAALLPSVDCSALAVDAKDDGSFTVNVGGTQWLKSAPIRLHADNVWSTLKKVSSENSTQTDALGQYDMTSVEWQTAQGTSFVTKVRDYTAGGIPAVVFEQSFPHGAKGTALGPSLESKEKVLSAFPSFAASNNELGFVAYYDQMVGGMANGTKVGVLDSHSVPGGTMGGPIILFDQKNTQSGGQNAVVLGHFSNFLAGSSVQDRSSGAIEFGLLGSITSIPANYSIGINSHTKMH